MPELLFLSMPKAPSSRCGCGVEIEFGDGRQSFDQDCKEPLLMDAIVVAGFISRPFTITVPHSSRRKKGLTTAPCTTRTEHGVKLGRETMGNRGSFFFRAIRRTEVQNQEIRVNVRIRLRERCG